MRYVYLAALFSSAMITIAMYKLNQISSNPKEAPLYERLGGIYAISSVINDFSDSLVTNPMVGQNSPNPQLRDWFKNSLVRLAGLKWMRTLWVADISGGPYKYVPTKPGSCTTCLDAAHKDLKITSEEFDEVAKILEETLHKHKVPDKERDEVLGAFAAHKAEVTSGSGKFF
jgi:hemoglobin